MIYSEEDSVKLMQKISKIEGIEFDYTPLDIGTESKEGYGDTRTTWNFIKDKVDFKDRNVIDIGACCGFIANKLLSEGLAASVWAVEINPQQCRVAEEIHKFNIGDSRLHVHCCNWINFSTPQIDGKWIITALNVVQHFKEKMADLNFKKGGKDYRKQALIKIFNLPFSHIIFEVDEIDRNLIIELMPKNYSCLDYKSPSRPKRRIVIIYENKKDC